MLEPKMVTNSPGAIGPARKLAAFVTAVIAGPDCVTMRVTEMVTGGALSTVRVMAPVCEPVARPCGFAPTVKLAGVTPLDGVTVSGPCTEVRKFSGAPELPIVIVC
jgi:hypothetical protein